MSSYSYESVWTDIFGVPSGEEKHHVVVKHKRPTRYGNYEFSGDFIGYQAALNEAAQIWSSCKARNLEPTKILIDGEEINPDRLPPVMGI